jgi:UDP-perosamine 4-acetyltransferase
VGGSEPVAVLGAGGHAKVVVSTLLAAGIPVVVVLDDDRARWGTSLLDIPISGPIASLDGRGLRRALIGIGSNDARRRLAGELDTDWVVAVHPTAWVHPSVRLGAGTVVFAGAVIQPDTVIGVHAIVNTGATVDHDCSVGSFAHLAPGSHLSGGVTIGEGVLMGIGSSAIPGVTVGEWSVIGAGAAVVDNLPAGVTAVGVPARPLQEPT